MIHLRLFHLFVFVSYLSQAKDAVSLLCIDKLGLALTSCWVWSHVAGADIPLGESLI